MGRSERVSGCAYSPPVATAPEGLLHPAHPALGCATHPMSSAGEGVALGPRGPLSRSRWLHSPVMGPVWDVQGPGDQRSEVGSWIMRWHQRCTGRESSGAKGQRWGFRVMWEGGNWMEGFQKMENSAPVAFTFPHRWGLPRSCPQAGSSSGCGRPVSHGLASGGEEDKASGCFSSGVIFKMFK